MEVSVGTPGDLAGAVSGNVYRGLKAASKDHALIRVRRRIGSREAVYADLLGLPSDDAARKFCKKNPRFGVDPIRSGILTKIEKLRPALLSASYDLGRIEPLQRLPKAKEFVRMGEGLERLEEALRGLSVPEISDLDTGSR